MKAGQSWCSAVICRNRSDFEMQFRLIVVSIFLKTCVKDRGSTLLISCKAVKRGLQFAIFFVNFVLTNGTVSYYSRYCLQVIIVLIHVYNWEIRHHSTVCRCGLVYIYIYFFSFFFLLDLCVHRETVVRGESRTEYLWKRPCYADAIHVKNQKQAL